VKRRGEASELAICEAVLGLLGEVGYDRMSMDAVAARAHAGKATIYRRWPNKAALVTSALRACSGADPSGDYTLPDTGSVRGDLLAIGEAKSKDTPAELMDALPGLLLAMRDDRQLASLVHAQLETDLRDVYREIVRRGVARGEISPDADPDLLVEVGFGLAIYWIVMRGKPIDASFSEYLVDRVLLPLVHHPTTSPSNMSPRTTRVPEQPMPDQISTDSGTRL
jgi:AcrR family transcriptional regulator